MIQWSQKISTKDKFSSVLKKGHALMNALRTTYNDIVYIYSQDFLFISPSQAKGRRLPPKLQGKGMKELLTPPRQMLNLKDGGN